MCMSQAVHTRGVAYMLQLPASPPQRSDDTATASDPEHHSPTAAAVRQPEPEAASPGAPGAAPAPTGWSTEGLPRLLRHGSAHMLPYAKAAAANYAAAGADLLQQASLPRHTTLSCLV